MIDDPRCCGSGTCIIDAEGRCWCGQQWNGQQMCHVPPAGTEPPADDEPAVHQQDRRAMGRASESG